MIGVVFFGDLPASFRQALYAARVNASGGERPVTLTPANVLGILSIIFAFGDHRRAHVAAAGGAPTIAATGGVILALATALVSATVAVKPWPAQVVARVGFRIFGAGDVYAGDRNDQPPAIPALGAVEGLQIIARWTCTRSSRPRTGRHRARAFAIQKNAAPRVLAVMFGPVMCASGSSLAPLRRVSASSRTPAEPWRNRTDACTFYAFVASGNPQSRLSRRAPSSFASSLAPSALYADMGHFGAATIRRAWLALAS